LEEQLRSERELDRVQALPLFAGRMEVPAAPPPGGEWGAASFGIGGVFAVMAPTTLILITLLETTGYRGFSKLEYRVAAVGGYLAAVGILLLVIAGVGFGLRGMIVARQQKRPITLGLAGVLINGLNLFMWMGAALAWHSSIWPRL
jgi:hypothetical protein